MNPIDTLEIYKDALASGLTEEQARFQVRQAKNLECSFLYRINELKDEFASNKVVSTFGTMILAVLVALWFR
jgi:hypothetical protein